RQQLPPACAGSTANAGGTARPTPTTALGKCTDDTPRSSRRGRTAMTDPRHTPAWQRVRRRIVAAARAQSLPCARCGRPIDYTARERTPNGPSVDHAATLIRPPAETGIEVTQPSTTDLVVAHGMFLDELAAGRLPHAGQPELDAAVRHGAQRPLGGATA